MTRVLCPRCRVSVEGRDELIGRSRCPKCGKVITGRHRQIEDIVTGTFGMHRTRG
jgi:Zn-finger nucleic acid-binding protein